MKRYSFQAILILILFFSVERFCHKQTHGFRIQKIVSKRPPSPVWETGRSDPSSTSDIQKILSQPFHFLNSGGECYVFASKDGKYVLKFFKHHHMSSKKMEDHILPRGIRAKYKKMRDEKYSHFYTSCKLAYEKFSKETGLLYLHLRPSSHLKTTLTLYDPIGVVHKLDMDQMTYAIQEKASLAYPTLSALAEAQEWESVQVRLVSLLDLIVSRCQAGLKDHDARKRNFGFVGERAIELDIGSFTADPSLQDPKATQKILLLETLKLRRWIKKYHPEVSGFLDKKIGERLRQNS